MPFFLLVLLDDELLLPSRLPPETGGSVKVWFSPKRTVFDDVAGAPNAEEPAPKPPKPPGAGAGEDAPNNPLDDAAGAGPVPPNPANPPNPEGAGAPEEAGAGVWLKNPPPLGVGAGALNAPGAPQVAADGASAVPRPNDDDPGAAAWKAECDATCDAAWSRICFSRRRCAARSCRSAAWNGSSLKCSLYRARRASTVSCAAAACPAICDVACGLQPTAMNLVVHTTKYLHRSNDTQRIARFEKSVHGACCVAWSKSPRKSAGCSRSWMFHMT